MANKKDRLTNELSKYVGLGQWAKAVQTLENLIQLEPTNTHYYLRMGDYSVKAGNKAGAIKRYYEAADMYVKAGFSVKAIATYKMILKIAPGETQATALMKSANTVAGGILFDAGVLESPQTPQTLNASPDPPPAVAEHEPEKAVPAEEAFSSLSEDLTGNLAPAGVTIPDEPVTPQPPSASAEPIAVMNLTQKKNIDQLFASFTQEEFGAIVDKLEPMEFMDGERIIAEGDEGNGMYLITRGSGKVVKDHKGQEAELCELGEGEFFGELSLLSGGSRSASVFAKGETEVLRLKSSDLFEVIKQYPRLESVLEQFAYAMRTKMRELPE
jgi:tetratricopeptide (TPR) repeat protein